MGHKSDCVICGGKVVYLEKEKQNSCFYCKGHFFSNMACENGHYVCDDCHSFSANEIITKYCENSDSKNPTEMACELMKHPSVKMHGPEHHFLLPAVLLTCLCNCRGDRSGLKEQLEEARKRSKNVPGGFCGYYGCCGAAVGVGIFISIACGATPLSEKEWSLANLGVSKTLGEIALNGGPRCCKRNSFIAIDEAVEFMEEHLGVKTMRAEPVKCDSAHLNKECKGNKCKFHRC